MATVSVREADVETFIPAETLQYAHSHHATLLVPQTHRMTEARERAIRVEAHSPPADLLMRIHTSTTPMMPSIVVTPRGSMSAHEVVHVPRA
jgi:hypothetical protein